MRAIVLLTALFLLVTSAGCRQSEALPDVKIVAYQESAVPARFAAFPKLEVVTSEPDPDDVNLEGIGLAADGAYIMVQFRAPLSLEQIYQQNNVYVVDEATRIVYKDIPVAPKIGPLTGRPTKEGQSGYVMLFNYADGIKSGAAVTVVLGKYKREHYLVP